MDVNEQLKKLPKVDIHRHLEGSFRIPTLMEIAREYNLDFPLSDTESFLDVVQVRGKNGYGYAEFLDKFYSCWHQNLDIVERLAYEAVEDAARDGLVLLEFRFAPDHYSREKGFDYSDIMDRLFAGMRRAGDAFGVNLSFIVTLSRHKQNMEKMNRLLDIIRERRDDINGIDLAGDEVRYPPELFLNVFRKIQDMGLPSTVHAGEIAPPVQIITSVEQLGASRIGHGITSADDPEVKAFLRERNVVLEICLTSNLHTGRVPDLSHHPIRTFLRENVPVTLNTDDPSISGIDMTHELDVAANTVGISPADIYQLQKNGITSSFASDAVKEDSYRRLEEGWHNANII